MIVYFSLRKIIGLIIEVFSLLFVISLGLLIMNVKLSMKLNNYSFVKAIKKNFSPNLVAEVKDGSYLLLT